MFSMQDSSVGKWSASQAGDPDSNPSPQGLDDLGHLMHEREGKRLLAVKFILHQLTLLTGA